MKKIILIIILLFSIIIPLISSPSPIGVNINPPTSATSPDSAIGVIINPPTSPTPISNTTPSNFLDGSVIFSDGINLAEDNDNFFWDDINNRLGLGTTSPNELLHIKKSVINDDVALLIENTDAGETANDAALMLKTIQGTWNLRNLNLETGDLAFVFGSTEIMRLEVGGNIGIGTSTPGELLDVDGNATVNRLILDRGVQSPYIERGVVETKGMSFFTVGSAKMTILEGGNVGIGTTSPGEKLDVIGNIFIDTTSGNLTIEGSGVDSVILFAGVNLILSGEEIEFEDSTGEIMRIVGGKVGINTTTPTHTLNVVGDANITGDIYSNSYQVISYQRTVNIRNVTMTAVI